ncbi:MAG: phage tail sheath C-terminal domain-containing protein [Myxococcota bacterium]|nr:phage tail sheath C-terminal domain-containing protein [Myxococcota bacterium]
MDYSTPGVYIREVDSGAKPIASVATSIPGFMGLFPFSPPTDAIAITGNDGSKQITGKVLPALVDKSGNIKGDAAEATATLRDTFKRKASDVKDLGKYLNLHGVKLGGKGGATIKKEGKDISVSFKGKTVTASADVLAVDGKVLSDDDAAVNELLSSLQSTFELVASPKSASEVFEAYGLSFEGAEETSLQSEYSIPPYSVTNKGEFFRWLQGFFAQYLYDTRSTQELLGEDIEDPDDAVDAIFEAVSSNDDLKKEFSAFLSQPSVFNLVTSVNGFYDNGGGKAYVYLMGVSNTDCSIRENQADKIGLYAFDDIEDMALMAAPGLSSNQQRELLEHCETRKDRFAILDGPIVSSGDMDIPASAKGYGAIYVPWLKVTKPSWFTANQDHITVSGANRRKLQKTEKNEVFVPPSGHICGIIARVDTERGVHKAPANEVVMGITGISQSINRLEQGQYNDRGINCIREFKDRGIRVWGARTLGTKSDPSWKYINVRRLFIMVEQSILLGSQWAVFEPNDQTLWKKLTRDVRSYLMRVWRSGALFGATADEAFYVKCDTETNPRYLIDAGQVNVQIGICPVKPAEFVIFSIGQWDGGALIEE